MFLLCIIQETKSKKKRRLLLLDEYFKIIISQSYIYKIQIDIYIIKGNRASSVIS